SSPLTSSYSPVTPLALHSFPTRRSSDLPITILSTLPSAGIGALLTLMAVGEEFTVIAMIGVFLLIGIVKKNAIMMVDYALMQQRSEEHTSELQSRFDLVCRLLLEKNNQY